MPRYGVDMGEDCLPIEAGVNDAVSFTKGCYLGQEVIARATNLGHINRRLVGLILDGDAPAKPGAKLSAATRPEAWLDHDVGALAPARQGHRARLRAPHALGPRRRAHRRRRPSSDGISAAVRVAALASV